MEMKEWTTCCYYNNIHDMIIIFGHNFVVDPYNRQREESEMKQRKKNSISPLTTSQHT